MIVGTRRSRNTDVLPSTEFAAIWLVVSSALQSADPELKERLLRLEAENRSVASV